MSIVFVFLNIFISIENATNFQLTIDLIFHKGFNYFGEREREEVIDTGLQLFGFSRSPLLKNGIIWAILGIRES